MKLYYDFHIHTCLSPCGDNDMTPNNIINMATLKGLDVIAITDHNSAKNVAACIEAAKESELLVIPGMEIETAEEVHMVALFDDIKKLYALEQTVDAALPPIKNKPAIFGEQIIMNSNDEVEGFEERFLITATALSVQNVYKLVRDLGGVIFPAHIDKSSYSIISNLGFIPSNMKFGTVEIKNKARVEEMWDKYDLAQYTVIHDSDAHYLWDIAERENTLEVRDKTISDILYKLQ